MDTQRHLQAVPDPPASDSGGRGGGGGNNFESRLVRLETLMEGVATKEDIGEVKLLIAEKEKSLGEVKLLIAEKEKGLGEVKVLIIEREASLQRWLIGILLAALSTVTLALVRLFS